MIIYIWSLRADEIVKTFLLCENSYNSIHQTWGEIGEPFNYKSKIFHCSVLSLNFCIDLC